MTAGPFHRADFTDGSAPGSDPYDNPNPEYQKPSPESSAGHKANAANLLAAFLADPTRATFEPAVEAISRLTGWGNVGSFQNYDDPVKLATLVERFPVAGHPHHNLSRPRLWCDVEERVQAWLISSGEGERIRAAGATYAEARERKQLRALLDKYPDEAVRA